MNHHFSNLFLACEWKLFEDSPTTISLQGKKSSIRASLLNLEERPVAAIQMVESHYRLTGWIATSQDSMSMQKSWIVASTFDQVLVTSNLLLQDWGYKFVPRKMKAFV